MSSLFTSPFHAGNTVSIKGVSPCWRAQFLEQSERTGFQNSLGPLMAELDAKSQAVFIQASP